MPRKIKRLGPKNAVPRSDRTRRVANRRGTSHKPAKLVYATLNSRFIRGIPVKRLCVTSRCAWIVITKDGAAKNLKGLANAHGQEEPRGNFRSFPNDPKHHTIATRLFHR